MRADDAIQRVKVYAFFPEHNGFHAAADIYADHARHHFIRQCHRRADGTAFTRVRVRHNANFRIGERLLIANHLNLLPRLRLQSLAKALCRVVRSSNGNHVTPPIVQLSEYSKKTLTFVKVFGADGGT